MSRSWIAAGAFAVVVGATAAVHARIPPEPKALAGDEAFVPRPEVAKLAALGFDSVVSDFHWLRAVQVTGGDEHDIERHGALLGRLIDVVTTLNPYVDHPYRFAAVWMTESEATVRHANRILERGIAHHPDDWRMHFHKGFNHFFYLEEYEEAAAALDAASRLTGAPRYLPRLVARLRSRTGDLETAAIFLEQLVRDAADEAERAEYRVALDEIAVERAARFLDRARNAYRQLNGRDIENVADLLDGEHPVLRALPPAVPPSLPTGLRRDSRWQIDPESGRIVSSYYGRRYELSFHWTAQERRAEWRERRGEAESKETGRDDG